MTPARAAETTPRGHPMLDPYQLTLHTLTLRQLASAEQLESVRDLARPQRQPA